MRQGVRGAASAAVATIPCSLASSLPVRSLTSSYSVLTRASSFPSRRISTLWAATLSMAASPDAPAACHSGITRIDQG